MKHRIFYFLFFLSIVTTGYAQDYKKAAEQQFLQYTDLIIKKDFRSASEFIIEDMFQMISKEQMILAMEKVFNMPEFQFRIDSPRVLQISDSKKVDTAHFLKLKYSNILRMKFDNEIDSSQTDSSTVENEMLTMTLQSKFGENNVKYSPNTGYYNIYSEKDVIAKSPDLKKWKFIVMDDDKKPFLKKLVPAGMLE